MSDLFLYHDQRKAFIAIRDGMTIERNDGDFKFSGDPLVSSLHCKIHLVGRSVYIEDLDSNNRTQVNRVPIVPRRRRGNSVATYPRLSMVESRRGRSRCCFADEFLFILKKSPQEPPIQRSEGIRRSE